MIDEGIIDDKKTWKRFVEYNLGLFCEHYDPFIEEIEEFKEMFDIGIECAKQLLYSKYYAQATRYYLLFHCNSLIKYQQNMGTQECQPYIDFIQALLNKNNRN